MAIYFLQVFAMPETALGLFPDVGASYYLSRLPGFFGITNYLNLHTPSVGVYIYIFLILSIMHTKGYGQYLLTKQGKPSLWMSL